MYEAPSHSIDQRVASACATACGRVLPANKDGFCVLHAHTSTTLVPRHNAAVMLRGQSAESALCVCVRALPRETTRARLPCSTLLVGSAVLAIPMLLVPQSKSGFAA